MWGYTFAMALVHIIRLALGVAVVVALMHGLATAFYLYSFYWWFDIPLHFLGGFCAALVSLFFYSHFHRRKAGFMSSTRAFFVATVGVIAVGVMWELFEYFTDITFNAIGDYALDTVKDLGMDILGGYAAYVYFICREVHKHL